MSTIRSLLATSLIMVVQSTSVAVDCRAQTVVETTGVPNQAIASRYNWSQSSKAFPQLAAGAPSTVTLNRCPLGVDVSGSSSLGGPQGGYPIYISDGPQSEAVYVSGGSCRSDEASGTVVFTPYFSHPSGAYTLQSASSGIQEAINVACGASTTASQNAGCWVVVPPDKGSGINVYGTIYFHTNQSHLSGHGATLNCQSTLRGPCLQVGNLGNSGLYNSDTIEGLNFRSPVNVSSRPEYAGSLISSLQRSNGQVTVNTTAGHGFRTGDMVDIQFTDSSSFWGDVPRITVTGPTSFTYPSDMGAYGPSRTPGVVALSYEPILDNAQKTYFKNIQYDFSGENGHFNQFFDFWDDEDAIVDGFGNSAISLNKGKNWTGSFIYSGGARNLPHSSQQLAPVITIKDSNITANGSNCVTVLNSNGVHVRDTVCQASGPWQFKITNAAGNYQGAFLENIYAESASGSNCGTCSPWGGLGIAGLIGGPIGGSGVFELKGLLSGGGLDGAIPTLGSGASRYVYYIVVHNATKGTATAPLPAMYGLQNSPGTVRVAWPRVANEGDAITYDGIRCQSGVIGSAAGQYVAPYGSLPGGSPKSCGSIFTRQAQQTGFIQTFSDSTANATSAYTVAPDKFPAGPDFWPGNAVLTSTPLQADQDIIVTGINFQGGATVIAPNCNYGQNTNGGYTACFATQLSVNNAIVNNSATMMQDGAISSGGWLTPTSKGRLNFIMPPGEILNAHHIITLVDSNPAKTIATSTHRPSADSADVWIGLDNGSVNVLQAQLAFGGPVAISNYIGNVGDNASWKERLTATAKTFNVPVVTQSLAFAALPRSPVNGEWVYCTDCTVSTPASCRNVTTPAACTCAGGGTGAEAKRINGAWLCN